MKKATVLGLTALALVWTAPEAGAQQQNDSQKKIRITIKEGEGEVQVYEYNSRAEMEADKRLDGKIIPPPIPALPVLPPLPDAEGFLMLKEHNISRHADSIIIPSPGAVPAPPAPPAPAATVPEADEIPVPADAPAKFPSWIDELMIYPNAADNKLRVSFRTQSRQQAVLRLIDLTGKLVYEEKIDNTKQGIDKTIALPKNTNGVLVLQIQQAGKTYSKRVVVD